MQRTALLIATLLTTAAAVAADRPSVTAVTADQLWKAPEKYQGKLVRLEGIVEFASEHPRRDEAKPRYSLDLEGNHGVYIVCEGKPSVSKGDRVRVTGTFTYKKDSFVRHRVAVPVDGVEKLPAKK